jgi:hypothetical protein
VAAIDVRFEAATGTRYQDRLLPGSANRRHVGAARLIFGFQARNGDPSLAGSFREEI